MAFRPPTTPLAPKPYRPVAPPAWVNHNFDSGPLQGEQQSYFAACQRYAPEPICEEPSGHTTPSRQPTHVSRAPAPQPSRAQTEQGLGNFPKPAPPTKRPSFWTRLFCGSPDEPAPTRCIAQSACRMQPSVAARRRARLAGDEDELYRHVTGRCDRTGQVFYGPRYG